MHYCVYLFTNDEPTEEEIEKIMEPYEENTAPRDSSFMWDWYEIGGRWLNILETKSGCKCSMAKIHNLKIVPACHTFIDIKGNVISNEEWIGGHWYPNTDFLTLLQQAINEAQDGFITVIDVHD